MASYEPVVAVLRALAVLKAVSLQGRATVNSIYEETDISRPTIIRMLETLQHAGLVVRDTPRSTYFVSGKTLELSKGFEISREIAVAAGPVLEKLEEQTGWPSNIAVFDVDAMVIAAASRASRLFDSRRTGIRLPLLASAAGRAYIAFAPREERDAAFTRLRSSREPWDDFAHNRKGVETLMAKIREVGYATPDERYARLFGSNAVTFFAVPVMAGGAPIATLDIGCSREALSADAPTRLMPMLTDAAQTVVEGLHRL